MHGRKGGWLNTSLNTRPIVNQILFLLSHTNFTFLPSMCSFFIGNSYLADNYVRCTTYIIHIIATGFHPRLFILYFLTLQYMYDLYITFAFSSLLKRECLTKCPIRALAIKHCIFSGPRGQFPRAWDSNQRLRVRLRALPVVPLLPLLPERILPV